MNSNLDVRIIQSALVRLSSWPRTAQFAANEIGVSRSAYYRYIKSPEKLPLEALAKLVELGEIMPSELFYSHEETSLWL